MNLKLTLILPLLVTGCAFNRTVDSSYNEESKGYDKTTYVGIYWFNKSATAGLTVGKRSEKETTTLSVKSHTTETQSEAISSVVEAAVKGAVRGVVP